jgi:hypothetical protein
MLTQGMLRYSGNVCVSIRLSGDQTKYVCEITDNQDNCIVHLDIEATGGADIPRVKLLPDICDRVASVAIENAISDQPTAFPGCSRNSQGALYVSRSSRQSWLA